MGRVEQRISGIRFDMGGSCLLRADQAPLEEQAVAGGKPSSMMANPEGLWETRSPS